MLQVHECPANTQHSLIHNVDALQNHNLHFEHVQNDLLHARVPLT